MLRNTQVHKHNTVPAYYQIHTAHCIFCVLQSVNVLSVVACMTYSEEAVEVWEIKSVCDLSQDIQRQLPLIGGLAALIRCAPQGRRMTRMQ